MFAEELYETHGLGDRAISFLHTTLSNYLVPGKSFALAGGPVYNKTWRLVSDITHLLSFTRVAHRLVYAQPALLGKILHCVAMLQNSQPFKRQVGAHVEFETSDPGLTFMEQNYHELVRSVLCGLRAGPNADLPHDLVAERANFPKRQLDAAEFARVKQVIGTLLAELSLWARNYYGDAPLAQPPVPNELSEGAYVHLTLHRLFASFVSAVLSQFTNAAPLQEFLSPAPPMPLPLPEVLATLPLHLHSVVAEAMVRCRCGRVWESVQAAHLRPSLIP